MEILNEILRMQKEGLSDQDIYTRLRNNGISPKQIKDAVNQAKIKNAVSEEFERKTPLNQSIMDNPSQMQPPLAAPSSQDISGQPYQPVPFPQPQMGAPLPTQNPSQEYAPAPQEYSNESLSYPQNYPEQNYPSQPELQAPAPEGYENYYPQTPQGYSDQNYYAPQGAIDSQTISEIAEAMVSEKINELKKETGDIPYFQKKTEEKLNDLDERLKRIESMIDKLQIAVLDKIGEFGQSTSLVHKDLDNLHGTVSKLMNPLLDNYQELQKLTNKH